MPNRKKPPKKVSLAIKAVQEYLAAVPDVQVDTPSAKDIIRAHFSKMGKKGSRARARKLTPERRREIARNAVRARWQRRKNKAAANNSLTAENATQ